MRKIRIVAARLTAAMTRVAEYSNDHRLAKALGTNPSRVASWRTGEHLPSAAHLFSTCELLGVPPQFLFGELEEEARGRCARELRAYGLEAEAEILIALRRISAEERRRLVDKALGWVEASISEGAAVVARPLPAMPYDELERPLSEERPPSRGRAGSPPAPDEPAASRKR